MSCRIVLRTVRDGQVIIYGRRYEPEQHHMVYDGRLEGLRFAFGLYSAGVRLWGSEDAYRASRRTAFRYDQARYRRDSPQVVDGTMPWYFWREVINDA
jgi:hypothetical protein